MSYTSAQMRVSDPATAIVAAVLVQSLRPSDGSSDLGVFHDIHFVYVHSEFGVIVVLVLDEDGHRYRAVFRLKRYHLASHKCKVYD